MDKEKVLKKIDMLPVEAQREAKDFVQYLYDRYVGSRSPKKTKGSISESGFVGMWKNREDLKDSTIWVKGQREKQWKETKQ